MSTGEKIRAARRKAGLTQKKLGELCGIAEPTIRRYELNKLNPKLETILKIAGALGVDYADLYGDNITIGDSGGKVCSMGISVTQDTPTSEIVKLSEEIADLLKKLENNDAELTSEILAQICQQAVQKQGKKRYTIIIQPEDAPEPSPPPSDSKDAAAGENPVEGLEKPGTF